MKEIIIKEKQKNNLMLSATFFILFCIFAWFTIIIVYESSIIEYKNSIIEFNNPATPFYIILLAIMLFDTMMLYHFIFRLKRFIKHTPNLTITDEGILNVTVPARAFIFFFTWYETIPNVIHWDEIASFEKMILSGKGYIKLIPKDMNCVLKRVGYWKRFFIRSGISFPFTGSLYFGSRNADMTIDKYLSLLNRHLKS